MWGIGTYVHITAQALARRGHEVHVVVSAGRRREQHSDDQGVTIHSVPAREEIRQKYSPETAALRREAAYRAAIARRHHLPGAPPTH